MGKEYDYRVVALDACKDSAKEHYPGFDFDELKFVHLETISAAKIKGGDIPELELFMHSEGNYRLWRWHTTCQGQDVVIYFQTNEGFGTYPMNLIESKAFGGEWKLDAIED